MQTITLYKNSKTHIVYFCSYQTRYIKIYSYDADGYVENAITLFDPETIETFLEKF